MNDKWRGIWDRRSLDAERGSILTQLMTANGYDTGFGDVVETAWRKYVRSVAERLDVGPGQSVFDVGCGAGAFLLPLQELGCSVGGLDYSEALLAIAREHVPGIVTESGEAAQLDTEKRYDAVVSSGVFLYFPSFEYAANVLASMRRKARRVLAVLDVPDRAKEEEAMAIRIREIGEDAYRERYRGLSHLYFDRSWFVEALAELGVSDVSIESQNVDDYKNNAYRFNVFARL